MRGYIVGLNGLHIFGMIACAVVVLAVIAAIVWLIVWAVRSNKRNAKLVQSQQQGPTHKEIVQARYARGEITQTEYKKILADLDK
jgi:putative membrane protein